VELKLNQIKSMSFLAFLGEPIAAQIQRKKTRQFPDGLNG
jgi:hypothetical protein